LGLENLQRLHAERALLKQEQELLQQIEDSMTPCSNDALMVELRENMEHTIQQKKEAQDIIKRYGEKIGQ
jgi:hypothetical protein